MRYLWDTNICVTHLRHDRSNPGKRLRELPDGDVVICSLVNAELIFGALKHPHREREMKKTLSFLNGMTSLPFDSASAEYAAKFRHRLAVNGTPIGPHDVQIAAIAAANGLILVTSNTREFARITELRIEDWK